MFIEYVNNLRANGRICFTTDEALNELEITLDALHSGIYRLKKRGLIISPAKHLYVIVPPEDLKFGSIPAEDLIPLMMNHTGIDYYVGLLSAALYHGASHQKPQVFQVVANKQLKPLVFGRIKIAFIYKKEMGDAVTVKKIVKTGYLKVSTPEYTLMDLFLYPKHAGGLNHIATVLSELIDGIDTDKLISVFELSDTIHWIQRLGYILETIEGLNDSISKPKPSFFPKSSSSLANVQPVNETRLIDRIYEYVSTKNLRYIPLAKGEPRKDAPKNHKWKIIENTVIESDL